MGETAPFTLCMGTNDEIWGSVFMNLTSKRQQQQSRAKKERDKHTTVLGRARVESVLERECFSFVYEQEREQERSKGVAISDERKLRAASPSHTSRSIEMH